MGFVFRLESVLNYRRRLVDRQSQEVAAAGRLVRLVAGQLAELDLRFQAALEDDPGGRGGIRVQDLMVKAAWLGHLRGQRRGIEGELARARERLAQAQGKLTEAWRDLEVLERLKRKQHATWLQRREKLESKAMDEIGQIRADRRRRSNLAPPGEQVS